MANFSPLTFLLFALFVLFLATFVVSADNASSEEKPIASEADESPCWKSKFKQRKEETRKRRLEMEARLILHHKRMIRYLETEPEKRDEFLKAELARERCEEKQKVEALTKELQEKWKKSSSGKSTAEDESKKTNEEVNPADDKMSKKGEEKSNGKESEIADGNAKTENGGGEEKPS